MSLSCCCWGRHSKSFWLFYKQSIMSNLCFSHFFSNFLTLCFRVLSLHVYRACLGLSGIFIFFSGPRSLMSLGYWSSHWDHHLRLSLSLWKHQPIDHWWYPWFSILSIPHCWVGLLILSWAVTAAWPEMYGPLWVWRMLVLLHTLVSIKSRIYSQIYERWMWNADIDP